MVVFRTQNRAMRPLRPTKLALLALAQTKEEAQAALSVLHQTKKQSSTTKSLDGDNRVIAEVRWDDGRSRSFPDLTSSLEKEEKTKKVDLDVARPCRENINTQENISQEERAFKYHCQLSSEGNRIQINVDVHAHDSHIPGTFGPSHSNLGNSRKAHRRSSSVGDIIESDRPIHEGDITYHLKTRVMPPSPTLAGSSVPNSPPPLPPRRKTQSQEDQWALPKNEASHALGSSVPEPCSLTEQNVKANEQQLSQQHQHSWKSELQRHGPRGYHSRSMDLADNFESETDDNVKGATAFQYDRNAPHRRLYNRSKRQPRFNNRPIGENEQTSDFFEDSTVKHDSDTSELNPETLKKILDMQEEILRCHPSHLCDPPGTRIRTPVKLQLTTEDFKETYARKEQEDMEDDEVSSPFRLRTAHFRMRPGDTMNKSGNNSYIECGENIIEEGHLQETQEEELVEGFSRSHIEDSKPW